jgi:hypothetical protein
MLMPHIARGVGTFGVVIVLIAYILLQMQRMDPYSFLYSFINLLGSIMILFSLYYEYNFPAVFIEVVWSFISIYGIYQSLKRRKKLRQSESTS